MYILISLISLAISYVLFRRVAGSLALTKLNLVSWFFYYQLISQSFIASILVVNGWDNHYAINRIGEDARFYGWLAVQYTMIALPLGMLGAVYLNGLNSNRRLFHSYINKPVDVALSLKDSFIRYPLYALSVVAVFSIIYTFAMLKTNPLFAALSGFDALSLAGLRQETHREFPGNVYIRNIFAIGLTPILAYISFAYWRQTKNKTDFIWFFTMFVSSFFILTYDLSKAPFVIFVLGFLFLLVLINGGVSKKIFYAFGLVAFVLILSAYFLIMDVVDPLALFSYNSGIGGRILLSQAAGTYFAFEHFPSSHDFIGFASLSNFFNNIFGLEASDRAARILMTIFNPKAVEAGLAGVMNSLFIAEAWANFGLFGVIIAPLYVGFIIQVIFMFFLRSRKTPLMLGLLAYLSYSFPVTGGFNDFFYNAGLMIVFFIFITVYIVGLLLKQSKRRCFENHLPSPLTP
ncbi:MAG: hypothetical protein IBX55_20090 [Methyloprofundus sp.]|nr:hypothetical protein [Methyloprofundus sp.]